MASTKLLTAARDGSNSTVAVAVAKLTCAPATPAVAASWFSMARAQAAHDIPETGKSIRSAVPEMGAAFIAVPYNRVARWPAPGRAAGYDRRQTLPLPYLPPGPRARSTLPGCSRVFVPPCARNCRTSSRLQEFWRFEGPYIFLILMMHSNAGRWRNCGET